MTIFKDYARLVLFTAGILVGVQVPNFIDQYAKRISAHHIEAKSNFQGYRATAAKHFNGDIEALLRHYEASPDRVFKDDAKNIKAIYRRVQAFSDELQRLDTSLIQKIVHVTLYANKTVLDETFSEYTYTVPLNQDAIVCGLCLGLIIAILFDLTLFSMLRIGGWAIRACRRAP